VYPNVVSLHLETEMGAVNDDGEYDKDFALTFSHRVKDGHTTATHYGLEIAKVAALPKDMLLWAKEAADRLSHLEESRRKDAPGTKVSSACKKFNGTLVLMRSSSDCK
jgi:DNA mismatch repair protein MSH4